MVCKLQVFGMGMVCKKAAGDDGWREKEEEEEEEGEGGGGRVTQ